MPTEGAKATGNTAIANHANTTFALYEVDFPFQIQVDRQQKSVDVKSIKFDDFNGQLDHNCSAHPRVDKRTGEFFVFNYGLGEPHVNCSVFDKERKLTHKYRVPLTTARMIHDFQITEKYIIIPDLPMEFDPKNAVEKGCSVYNFKKEAVTRYGFLRRGAKSASECIWVPVSNHLSLHYANSWDHKNAQGQDMVTIYAVTHRDMDFGLPAEHFSSKDAPQTSDLEKFVINLSTGDFTRTKLTENF